MTASETKYATDEDVALRASADFALLCPKDQTLAWGQDGVFGSQNRWLLISQSTNFVTQGLTRGGIIRLTQPSAVFRPPGEALVVDAIAINAISLRRKGKESGVGQPPGPPSGIAQVEFSITTLEPQIARASYDLNRRFGIDELISGQRPSDLFDPREVREATVLTVLHRQYLDLSRGGGEQVDSFLTKARRYKDELDELLARTVVHWTTSSRNSAPAVTRFGTRLSR